ncbi:hypothetical protein [Absidia glauca]|uniref:Uncharacterized protein n=1 Tax=Absidia glauca TaxID=4829 RepID=A0A163K187_ABSGL|nr:hypothetical protein [Absidia glauca]
MGRFKSTMARICNGLGLVPHAFRNPLRSIPNLTTCTSSPAAREPIPVVIPFDHLRNKGAMMQKVNVSHGETNMDKTARRRGLPVTLHSSLKVVVKRAIRWWCDAIVD